MQLLWTPAADQAMARLERDPALAGILAAVRRTLGRLERDPYGDRTLRTRQFTTEEYGQLRCTPVLEDWWIGWMSGPGPDEITIVFIAELSL